MAKVINGRIVFDSSISDGDICKRTSASTLGKVTAIPEGLIVPNDEITSFTNTVSSNEVGASIAAGTFNWTMTRNGEACAAQAVSGTNLVGSPVSVMPGTLRTYAGTFTPALAPATATTYTYTLATTGDDAYADTATSTIMFRWKRYWGISNSILTTDAQVIAALSSEFGSSVAVTKTFNASAGTPPNYLYYCYPVAWGLPTQTFFGGFAFSDYTVVTIVAFTNASGGITNYYLLRTNNTYSSAGLVWQLT